MTQDTLQLADAQHPRFQFPLNQDTGYENGTIYLKEAWGSFYFLSENIEGFFALLEEMPRR